MQHYVSYNGNLTLWEDYIEAVSSRDEQDQILETQPATLISSFEIPEKEV